jgi:hypothetical protein
MRAIADSAHRVAPAQGNKQRSFALFHRTQGNDRDDRARNLVRSPVTHGDMPMNANSKRVIGAGLAGLALIGCVNLASAPASAAVRYHHRYAYVHPHYYHRYYYHHHYGIGPAGVFGAIAGGLAAGALAYPYYAPPPYYYGPYAPYYAW